MLRILGSWGLVATLALAAAAPADAATSAQRFADTLERAKSAIRAKAPEFRAANEALELERCDRILEERTPPRRELDRYVMFLVAASVRPLFEPARPVLTQIVADLEAIPTRDPVLRSGRAAWRKIVATWYRFPLPDRPCDQLEAWAASGWKASARPRFDFAGFERMAKEQERSTVERKLRRAVRRLRALGVARYDAERFTGATLFDDVEDELDLTVEGQDGDEQPARLSPADDPPPRSPRAAAPRPRR